MKLFSLRSTLPLPLLAIALTANFQSGAQTIPDETLKKNITAIHNPLQNVLKLEPRMFEYEEKLVKPFRFKGGRQYGFLADNVHAVFPSMVSSKSYNYMYGKNVYRNAKVQTIDEVSLIPVLVASIQELHQEIEQLKATVQALQKTNSPNSWNK